MSPADVPAGFVYHVLNRGNDRRPILRKHGDGRTFLRLPAGAKRCVPWRLPARCRMSNHWLVGEPARLNFPDATA